MGTFRPALVVVDFQEDFCPPNGSLAVQGGRDIAGVINRLMDLPWILRIATQDWHPADHVSFASNHDAPHNKPFETIYESKNPLNEAESKNITLWPDHCVQGTAGAELISEFDQSKLDSVVKKGQDNRVEMYSAFRDLFTKPFVSESNLLQMLNDASITHVYTVGLAADFCVKYTAMHAAKEGYTTYVVKEATKAIDGSDDGMRILVEELDASGVTTISVYDSHIQRVVDRV